MLLQHLILRHFRNYGHAEVSFSPGVNLIQGKNGQGKTNLLEAIYFLSTGRSFRTHRLNDLIAFGSTHFYLEAHFIKYDIPQTIKIYYDPLTRKIQYNDTESTQFSSLLGLLPHILLAPEDHDLINGAPAKRRRFLDLHLSQMDPLYLSHLGRYCKAMKQRNQLLRLQHTTSLDAWEQIMATSATYLTQQRQAALDALSPLATFWMQILSNSQETLQTSYPASATDTTALLKEWQANRTKEYQTGHTQHGPHRDDVLIQINHQEARHFASEGQKRCGTTALRIAEWERFKNHLNLAPFFSIDDFGIQLDSERTPVLQGKLSSFGQVFLTTPQELPILTPESSRRIHVERGALQVGVA